MQMPLVSNEEEAAAVHEVYKRFAQKVTREEIFSVESAVWKMKFRPQPLPFVAMSVEEAHSVTDLSRWTNTKVRVIGCMVHDVIPWLASVNEEGGEYRVALDLTVVDPQPPFKHLIEVFGTLEIEQTTRIPQIQVVFYRNIDRQHLERYRAALEAQKPCVPIFIKRKSLQQQLDGRESPENTDPETALLIHPCRKSI